MLSGLSRSPIFPFCFVSWCRKGEFGLLPVSCPAICRRSMAPGSKHSNDCCTSEPARRPVHTTQPLQSLRLWPQSGGNAPVTCRSAGKRTERQPSHRRFVLPTLCCLMMDQCAMATSILRPILRRTYWPLKPSRGGLNKPTRDREPATVSGWGPA